jgi:hypothetical protein
MATGVLAGPVFVEFRIQNPGERVSIDFLLAPDSWILVTEFRREDFNLFQE